MTKSRNRTLIDILVAAPVALLLAFGAVAKSKVDPMPTDTARSYTALSNGTSSTLGATMKLSRTSVSFSKLKGEMKLQYSDVWNNGNDTDFGGSVYKVLNADAFFSQNKGRNGFCDEPVRWLTVMDMGNQFGGGAVRIGMLSIGDWRKYTPDALGACSADTFTLK
ncbi:hypothetical protein [Paraburkholderia unamae]|uniref:Uncharacterized protein n=1 Tax=Paraburkholderia unamae TaxID=219649 RepID=A0ABX5KUE4_9BURK|nr:hypothetical protein [Paraburkholderia unamae]PVX85640.1 hypothetical protein C7402_103217 [Paraburkholderia unamae]